MFGKKPNSGSVTATDLPDEQAAAPDFEPLWEPTAAAPSRKSVEALLLERGQVTEDQLAQAREVAAKTPGKSLAQVLLGMSAASEGQILSALAETLDVPFETPERSQVDAA